MQHISKIAGVSIILLLLSACDLATMGGPQMSATVPVTPSPDKPLTVFQEDAAKCTKWANQIITPAAQSVVNAAVTQMLIGDPNASSTPTSTMAITPQFTGMTLQQQFDIIYAQCMYANGNDVPGFEANKYVLPPPPGTPGYVPQVPAHP